jgi:hypothetical protein
MATAEITSRPEKLVPGVRQGLRPGPALFTGSMMRLRRQNFRQLSDEKRHPRQRDKNPYH